MEVSIMYIYSKKDIQKIDNNAVQQGFSLYSLMENVGIGLFQKVSKLLSKHEHILILAGRGNNGGDGIVLARYLKQNGYQVTLTFPLGNPTTTVAKEHLRFYEAQGFTIAKWNKSNSYDVFIDCLLGIGTKLPLQKTIREIITWCNQMNGLKIAIDLPTGVVADHGEVDQPFQANYTFCLHGIKPAAFLLPSSKFFGKVESIDIGLQQTSKIKVLQKEKVIRSFPQRRNAAAHKGTFGTSLLVAGNDHMPGSALLAAIGAIRTGTGKLTIATTKLVASIIATRVPEATFLLNGLQEIIDGNIPEKVFAVGIGPGIDDKEKVLLALNNLITKNVPLVVDAGALIPLNHWHDTTRETPVILTPHPGEFSRLTNRSIKDIQANRIQLAQNFAIEHQVTVILKGQYTVIAYPDGHTLINPTGNNALAKGGSGDVLTGMITSMLTTHVYWKDAVANAVYIHGLCADEWIKRYSSRSMTASDFDQLLPIVFKDFETNLL